MSSTQTTYTTRISVVHANNHLLSWKEEFKPNKAKGSDDPDAVDGADLMAKMKLFIGYSWVLTPKLCYIKPNQCAVFMLGKDHAIYIIQVKRGLTQCATCGSTNDHKNLWCPECGGSKEVGKSESFADLLANLTGKE